MWGLNIAVSRCHRRVPLTRRVSTPTPRSHSCAPPSRNSTRCTMPLTPKGGANPLASMADSAHRSRRRARRLNLPTRTRPGRPKVSILRSLFQTRRRRRHDRSVLPRDAHRPAIPCPSNARTSSRTNGRTWRGSRMKARPTSSVWLACVNGSTANRYSGWLFLYSEVLDSVPRDVARVSCVPRGDGPRGSASHSRAPMSARSVRASLAPAGAGLRQLSEGEPRRPELPVTAEVVRLILATDIRGKWTVRIANRKSQIAVTTC